jgi:site-specific recombinase XerD
MLSRIMAALRARRAAVLEAEALVYKFGSRGVEMAHTFSRDQTVADIPDVRIHDLRHTFASLLVSGGASLEMIGKLLGHTQIGTTQRYAHLIESPLRAGVNAVGEMLRPRLRVVGDSNP